VILLEAPASKERAQFIIDWVTVTYPDKPIKYVVPTHSHQDHAAGVRTIMAQAGVTLVVAATAEEFWRDTILAADSALIEDAMELSSVVAPFNIITIEGQGELTIGDDIPVTVHHAETSHADDLVIASFNNPDNTEASRFVFEGDLYNQGPGGTEARW